jgi:hypothetical protein
MSESLSKAAPSARRGASSQLVAGLLLGSPKFQKQ